MIAAGRRRSGASALGDESKESRASATVHRAYEIFVNFKRTNSACDEDIAAECRRVDSVHGRQNRNLHNRLSTYENVSDIFRGIMAGRSVESVPNERFLVHNASNFRPLRHARTSSRFTTASNRMLIMSNRPFSVVVIFLVASFVSFEGAVRANAADELERQLIHAAPALLKFAQEKGYKNVGVLKFRIKKGDRPGTDRAGTLNTNLALRTELALILANSVREPLGIVHDASAVAAKIPGASHLTQEGRQKLFTAKYPLAWGTESVEPDAFFTGAVAMDADLSSMTVALVAFDRSGV